MLDDWEENLAVITANRTKDDELVLIHLGDCLWKERSNVSTSDYNLLTHTICECINFHDFDPWIWVCGSFKKLIQIIAAHSCYLVAEANFEPYSDSARLCLIGADHWKHPRTYACPEAIQVSPRLLSS